MPVHTRKRRRSSEEKRDEHPERWRGDPHLGSEPDLPLFDDQDSTLWNDSASGADDRSVWPALPAALSGPGRRLLWEGLREAVNVTPGDPERALMVVEAFWRTMQIRRDTADLQGP